MDDELTTIECFRPDLVFDRPARASCNKAKARARRSLDSSIGRLGRFLVLVCAPAVAAAAAALVRGRVAVAVRWVISLVSIRTSYHPTVSLSDPEKWYVLDFGDSGAGWGWGVI